MNSYEIKKQIKDKAGSDPEGRHAFTIKAKNEEQERKLLKIKEIKGVVGTKT